MLFAWIATYTSGNGMMILFAGSIVLLLNKDFWDLKKILWFVSGVLMIILYFVNYVKPSYHPDILRPLINNPIDFIKYNFAFLGGAISENISYSISLGIMLVLFISFLIFKKFHKTDPIMFSIIIFVLLTSLETALSRFSFGIWQAVSSRYTIYSIILIICCYLAFVKIFYNKVNLFLILIFTVIALVFNYRSQKNYLTIKINEKKDFEENFALIQKRKISRFNFGWPLDDGSVEYAKRTLKTADSLGIFKFKYANLSTIIERIPIIVNKNVVFKFDEYRHKRGENKFLFTGYAFIEKMNIKNFQRFICFKEITGNSVYYSFCKNIERQDIISSYERDKTNYDMTGFYADIDLSYLNSKKFNIFLVFIDTIQNNKVVYDTNFQFPIEREIIKTNKIF